MTKGWLEENPYRSWSGEDEKVGGEEKKLKEKTVVEQENLIPLVMPPIDQAVIIEEDGDEEMELG